jgi:hypothetical protein
MTCFSILHYIILRCCSFYILMLHYIVSSYVYNVALKVFSCSWDMGRSGGNGDKGVAGSRGQGTMGAISISVLFQYVGRDSVNSIHGDERVYEGDRRPDTLTRRMFGR